MIKQYLALLFIFCFSVCYANIEDSTLTKLSKVESVEQRARILIIDGWKLRTKHPEKALEIVAYLEKDTSRINSIFLLDSLYRLKAYGFGNMNNRSATLSAHLSRLRVLSTIEENTKAHYGAYFEVAGVLINQDNSDLAKTYYYKCYEIAKKLENKTPLAEILMTIADYQIQEGKLDSAIINLNTSKEIFSKIDRLKFILGSIDLSLAKIYKKKGQDEEVLKKVESALKYADTISYVEFNILTFLKAGKLYLEYNKYDKAIKNLEIAERLGVENNKFFYLPGIYKSLAKAYEKRNVTKAYNYLWKYNELNDSVINEANNKTVTELKFKYEDEKKQLQISNLEKDKAIAETASAKKSQFIKTISIALALVLLLLTFLVFLIKKVKKANTLVNIQKNKVEERNKEINDSIQYAKRIQESIIPEKERFESIFPSSFSIYYPKDNLSGDFYWVYNVTTASNKALNLFALGDCTGHGVPGALLSILGINYLNLGAVDNSINSPGEALDYLNKGICNTFGYSRDLIRDGMDIVMGAIDKTNNELYYACAKNPIYIIREGELTVLKGDSQAIGNDDKDHNFKFSNFSFKLKKGDIIYCLSDGYQDQFGGKKGKKYKTLNLKKFLIEICENEMSKQKELLEGEFQKWKGNYEQIDDVTVLAIKY
ncbi:MAG: SpoIIE family protein phosphatase [Vicingaceae bacterium]|nr:SpoIIE family protein phosphatase [Vicingaceae bacterium]